MSAPRRQSSSGPSVEAALAMALPIVERLRQTAASETEDIAQGSLVPYEAYSARKNQGLLELNRLLPALAGATPSGACARLSSISPRRSRPTVARSASS